MDDLVRLDTRLAGQIHRYHTWPSISHQTVAEHTWQMLRIYLAVSEKVDPNIILHIIYHDIGEAGTGDIPYPVKHDNPALKAMTDGLEHKSQMQQLHFWDAFKSVLLMDEDKILIKQIELIEMAEWGMDQVCFGNSHGMIVASRCLHAVYHQDPCHRLVAYVKRRLRIFFAQIQFAIIQPKEDWWQLQKWEEKHGRE